MSRARRSAGGLLAAALLILPAAGAWPQPPAASPTTAGPAAAGAPEAAPPAEPIPVAEVAGAVARQAELLRRIDERLAALPASDASRGKLELLRTRRSELEEVLRTARQSRSGLRPLDELAERLRGLDADLAKLQQAEGARASELEAALLTLDREREILRLSLAAARRSRAPDETLQLLREADDRIERVAARVREARDTLLAVQSEVALERSRVAGLLQEVRELRAGALGALFLRTEAPLWRIGEAARHREAVRWSFDWRGELASARRYLALRSERLTAHGLLLALLLALFLQLRRLTRPIGEPGEEDRAVLAAALGRPVEAALTLALGLGPFFYPDAPSLLLNLGTLVLLVAVLRVLLPCVPAGIRPALLGIWLFQVADQARDLLAGHPFLPRLIFAGELAAGLALLSFLLRPARLRHLREAAHVSPTFRVLGRAARLARVAAAAALAAEILGFGRLASLLGETLLRGAYSGVLLYAGVRILEALASLALRAPGVRSLHSLSSHLPAVERRLRRLLRLAGAVAWAAVILGALGIADPVYRALGAGLTAELPVGAVSISLADGLVFGLTVFLTWRLARLVAALLDQDVFPRLETPAGVAYAATTLSRYAVFGFGFVLAVAALGVPLDRIVLLLSALGVGVGLGLQTVVNNFVSGLILLFERPVKVGDTVQIGDTLGEIRHIGIRSSRLRTWQGADILVPNGFLVSEQVINWTLSDRQRRIDLPVGVAYGTDPARVLALLDRVARAHPDVLAWPEPRALFLGFGESSLDFELRLWTDRADGWPKVRSDLAVAIYAALRDEGIEIPFPQRDLHLKSLPGPPAPASGRADPESPAGKS